jgi:hypothetical protein
MLILPRLPILTDQGHLPCILPSLSAFVIYMVVSDFRQPVSNFPRHQHPEMIIRNTSAFFSDLGEGYRSSVPRLPRLKGTRPPESSALGRLGALRTPSVQTLPQFLAVL